MVATYSIRETSARLGYSHRTIQRMVKDGRLRATKDLSGYWRVTLPVDSPEGGETSGQTPVTLPEKPASVVRVHDGQPGHITPAGAFIPNWTRP